jgi:aminocarboxymuconate-semialdehyde decarboxylase
MNLRAIDLHSHFFPREWEDLGKRFGTPDWPWMKHLGGDKAMVMLGEREFRPVTSACWDAGRRLEEMDRDGVDLQVMCSTPVLFAYARPPAQALYCAQLFNDAGLELAARGKGHLKTLCQVPLQDTDAACKELSRAMKAGHLGVQIGNHVGNRDLDDEGIIAFLQHCAAEGAAVLVHPWDMMGGARTSRWMMGWTVSMPAETQLSIVALILGGGFDRLPGNLRICFAHGGGSFAFLLGRLENAWRNRDVARGIAKEPPSRYLERFYVDSAVFDPRALRLLIEVMGEERVMLGSDYPFPLGEQRVGKLIRDMESLQPAARKKLLADNARRFLGLAP